MSRISIHEVTHERKEDDTMWYFPHLYSIRGIGLKFADHASNLSGMEGAWLKRLENKSKNQNIGSPKMYKGI
jgi:hypothetical protein